MIRIMVVDDHAVVRKGLSFIINAQDDMEVIADAADGLEALIELERSRIDIVLLDLSMPPGENGLVITKKIKEYYPEVKVIIMTMHDDEEYLFRAIKLGASGYLLKTTKDEEVLETIRSVWNGEVYIPSSVAPAIVRDIILVEETEKSVDSYNLLSRREQEVLPLIALGFRNKEIAEKLFISVKTVEVYKANIMHKLSFKKRTELVQYAIKKNIIDF